MKKRIIAIVMMCIVVLGVLAGCKKEKAITSAEAQQIVIDHTGAESKAISEVHVHIGENEEGVVCYNVYITVNRKSYTYVVHGLTGEILSITEGGGHSH